MAKPDANDQTGLVEVILQGVKPGPPESRTQYLELQERDGDRQVLVFIGAPEAMSIAFTLHQGPTERPMTHDALKQVIDALDGRLLRIVVGHEPESIFTADVVVRMADGTDRHLDWRVSDAVALAVRCDPRPPILVPESLLAAPPTLIPWPHGAWMLCSCGQFLEVGQDDLEDDPAANFVEGTVPCPSCGRAHHVRLPRSPAENPGPQPEA